MNYIFLIICGLLGGIIGSMGMGGGTLLIPLLTIFGGISQHLAQSINLLAFIPMGIIAIIIHTKHHLIDYKKAIFIIVPAIVGAIIGALLSTNTNEKILAICFGSFLIILGIVQLLSMIFMLKKKK